MFFGFLFIFCKFTHNKDETQKKYIQTTIYEDKIVLSFQYSSIKKKEEYTNDFLEALNLSKKLFPDRIFGFSDTIHKKIFNCRNGSIVNFTKDEIKKILSFGITVYEPNDNLSKHLFCHLMNGMYSDIICDYLLSIREILIKKISFQILKEFENYFDSEFFYKHDYKYSIIFTSDFKKIYKLNNLICKNNETKIVNFFVEILNEIYKNIDVENKLLHMYIYDELKIFYEIHYYLFKENFIRNITKNYKKYFEFIKEFDEIIYFNDMKLMRKIQYKKFEEILQYLSNKISICSNLQKFQLENYVIFFAIDFLHNYFLNYCIGCIPIIVYDTNGNILEFNHCKSDTVMNIPLSFKLQDISIWSMLQFYDLKIITIAHEYLNFHSRFLEIIFSMQNCILKIKKSFIYEYNKNKIIRLDFLQHFLDYLYYYQKKIHSILLDGFITHYNGIKYVSQDRYQFESEISLSFLRYNIRMSYIKNKDSNSLNEKNIDILKKIYEILTPKIDQYRVILSPLFKSETNEMPFYDKMLNKIVEFSLFDECKNNDDFFVFECDNLIFNSKYYELCCFYGRILIFGSFKEFNCDSFLNIYILSIGNFFYIIFTDPKGYQDDKNPINLNLNITTTELPINPFFISTISNLSIYFLNSFKFLNKSFKLIDKKQVSLECGILFAENVLFYILNIPKNIKTLHFVHSINPNNDITKKIKMNSDGLVDFSFFEFCTFEKTKIFSGRYDSLKFESCTFVEKIFFDNQNCEFKNLIFSNCYGSILLDKIKFNSKFALRKRKILCIQTKILKIDGYNVYGSFERNLNIDEIEIYNSKIYVDISYFFRKILIHNCDGNFSIFLCEYDYYFGNIIITRKNGVFEIEKKADKIFFTFKEIFFDKNPIPFLKKHKNFITNIDNCNI